jgi:signal transduction histidine kinase
MTSEPVVASPYQPLLDRLAEAAGSSADWAALLPQLTHLLERLDGLERHFQDALTREKLAAMQGLAYGASHEINNPLANIAARAQTLLLDEKDPQRRRSLATINAQAFRAHEMIADLMLFAKPPSPQKTLVNLAALAERVVGELADEAAEQGTELMRADAGAATFFVNADEVQIGMAIRALCQNALQAVRHGGRIRVSLEQRDENTDLSVIDNGPGLTDEARKHLFDPFYSGREAGRGLGLGLSKVWRIMELHGGQVLVSSGPTIQTTFTLVFPQLASAAASV